MTFQGPMLDAPDAVELARFYATVLRWRIADEIAGEGWSWAVIASPDGLLSMEFQGRVDYSPPTQPFSSGTQHVHIAVDMPADVAAYAEMLERAVALGASIAEHQPRPDAFTVLVDPAGHSFSLVPTASR